MVLITHLTKKDSMRLGPSVQEIPCLPISTKFKTWIVKYYSLANWGYL